MNATNRKSVTILLCRHWVQRENPPGITSTWGVANPLDDTEGKQDNCIATAKACLPGYDIEKWGSSPVLRARQSASRAAAICGVKLNPSRVKTYTGLASPDFDLEDKIFDELKAAGVKIDNAKEIWDAMNAHSPQASMLARAAMQRGFQTIIEVARMISNGKAAALYSHHPYVPWIVAQARNDFDDMVMVEKGGIVEMHFVVADGRVRYQVDRPLRMHAASAA